MNQPPESPPPGPFRVSFVTGVTPDKWATNWRQRSTTSGLELIPITESRQLEALRDGEVQMAFVRLPVDRDGLHLIPLYREVPVVVVHHEHPVAAYDEIPVEDLADEHLLQDPDDVPEWRDLATEVRDGTRFDVPPMTLKQAVESVAAQAGILVLPMSVARVHHRKDVVAVPVRGVPETQVGLAWPVDAEDPRFEEFIGVVRGRTVRSSRGSAPAPAVPATKPAPKSQARPARGKKPKGGARKNSGRGRRSS